MGNFQRFNQNKKTGASQPVSKGKLPERSVTMSTPSKSNNSGGKFLSQEQLAVATNALRRILRNVEILERIKKDIYRVTRILS